MIRITTEFKEILESCMAIGHTNTAEALLTLEKGNIDDHHLENGAEIPLYLNKSIDDVGKISFATKRRIEENSWSDEYAASPTNHQRVKSKVGKALKRIFIASFIEDCGITNNDIEVFTSQLKGLSKPNRDNHFIDSKDFSFYLWENTCEDARDGRGSLGESCMRSESQQDGAYFQLYEDDDTPVTLIMHEDSDGSGYNSRALLWDIDGTKVLDRIYHTHDGDTENFKLYAKKQGWIYKSRQSYSHKTEWIGLDGETFTKGFIIPVAHFDDMGNFPYIDTFSYGFENDGGDCYLTNSPKLAWEEHKATTFRSFDSTGGDYSHVDITLCYKLDSNGERYEDAVLNETVSYVDNCEIGEGSLLIQGTWATYDSNGDRVVTRIRNKEGNRVYHHTSELKRCMTSNEWFPLSYKFIEVDGNMVDPNLYIKDYKGDLQLKARCAVYLDKNDKPRIINTNNGAGVCRDVFGANRLQSECTYVGGRIDNYVHNKEVGLIAMLIRRINQAYTLSDVEATTRQLLNY